MLRHWYILRVVANTEKSFQEAQDPLRSVLQSVLVPVIRSVKKHRRYKGIKALTAVPAFSGYIFVELDEDVNWQKIKSDSRVLAPVNEHMWDGSVQPFRVPEEVIELIKMRDTANFGFDAMGKMPPPVAVGDMLMREYFGNEFAMIVDKIDDKFACLKVAKHTNITSKVPLSELQGEV